MVPLIFFLFVFAIWVRHTNWANNPHSFRIVIVSILCTWSLITLGVVGKQFFEEHSFRIVIVSILCTWSLITLGVVGEQFFEEHSFRIVFVSILCTWSLITLGVVGKQFFEELFSQKKVFWSKLSVWPSDYKWIVIDWRITWGF